MLHRGTMTGGGMRSPRPRVARDEDMATFCRDRGFIPHPNPPLMAAVNTGYCLRVASSVFEDFVSLFR